jgi:hypothetical protein
MKTLNSSNISHMQDKDGFLGILICSVGYKKKVRYKGHKYNSVEELMRDKEC